MKFPKKRQEFTVSEVSKACGVSRTTLIRMEESGFLKPYRIDPYSGYRYYDAQNVAAIGQYQWMQSIGLSRKEITDLYYGKKDKAEFVREQRERLREMQQFIDEFEIRSDHSKNLSMSFIDIPEKAYYCTYIEAGSVEECATKCFIEHEKCIRAGYRMLGNEPPFGYFEDYREVFHIEEKGYSNLMCIPVMPGPKDDPNIRIFPATKAYSIVGFGYMSNILTLWNKLMDGAKAQRIIPSGPARVYALVAPYTGTHFKEEDFCFECVIPVMDKEKIKK